MPAPLALTDSQITAVMQLSRPLQPDQRVTFVELLVAKLNGRHEIGDGELHRLCAAIQKELYDPPLNVHVGQPHHGVRKRSAIEV